MKTIQDFLKDLAETKTDFGNFKIKDKQVFLFDEFKGYDGLDMKQ